jgi:hypothetical protein
MNGKTLAALPAPIHRPQQLFAAFRAFDSHGRFGCHAVLCDKKAKARCQLPKDSSSITDNHEGTKNTKRETNGLLPAFLNTPDLLCALRVFVFNPPSALRNQNPFT